jgi:hypothetical protein
MVVLPYFMNQIRLTYLSGHPLTPQSNIPRAKGMEYRLVKQLATIDFKLWYCSVGQSCACYSVSRFTIATIAFICTLDLNA